MKTRIIQALLILVAIAGLTLMGWEKEKVRRDRDAARAEVVVQKAEVERLRGVLYGPLAVKP